MCRRKIEKSHTVEAGASHRRSNSTFFCFFLPQRKPFSRRKKKQQCRVSRTIFIFSFLIFSFSRPFWTFARVYLMDSDPDLEIIEKDSGMSSLGGSKDETPERRAVIVSLLFFLHLFRLLTLSTQAVYAITVAK